MKSKILTFKSKKHLNTTITCIEKLGLQYRQQTTLTGINDIELYYDNASQLTELENEYINSQQHKIF